MKNIIWKKTTFEDFVERFQKKYDFKISLNKPYKLCDFRPAYGEVLYDDIKDYDFWGHCDCDMILGDIRKFVTDDILETYSKIFTRGHLSLYKNDKSTNVMYRSLVDYRSAFQTDKPCTLDEWAGISGAWKRNNLPYYDELLMDDIMVSHHVFFPTKCDDSKTGPYTSDCIHDVSRYKKMKNITYLYDTGKLYRRFFINGSLQSEEVLYVHFQKRQMSMTNLKNSGTFVVVPNKFINFRKKEYSLIEHYYSSYFNVKEIVLTLKELVRKIIGMIK